MLSSGNHSIPDLFLTIEIKAYLRPRNILFSHINVTQVGDKNIGRDDFGFYTHVTRVRIKTSIHFFIIACKECVLFCIVAAIRFPYVESTYWHLS